MAHIGLFCISMVVLLIGFSPSSAKDCTIKNIKQCEDDNINTNGCRFNKRILACLDSIEGCTSDATMNSLEKRKKYFGTMAVRCPGLVEGDCQTSFLNRCVKDIPDFGDSPNMLLPENQHKCTLLKSKARKAKKCIITVIDKCPHATTFIFFHINVNAVVAKEKLCGYVSPLTKEDFFPSQQQTSDEH